MQEAPYDQLHITGLSPEYLSTKRAGPLRVSRLGRANLSRDRYRRADQTTDKRTKPDDVKRSVHAAFDAGANGVVLAREYTEMWLANLSAAGDALREVFANVNNLKTKSRDESKTNLKEAQMIGRKL